MKNNNRSRPMTQEGKKLTTALKINITIGDTDLKAIVDTGAAISVITNTLRKRLGTPISETSNIRCTIANGNKIASLGRTEIDIEVQEWIIPAIMEVIDSEENELIIGNDILKEWNANINFEDKTLILQDGEEIIEIPTEYYLTKTQNNQVNPNGEESDFESEESEYESGETVKRQENLDKTEYNPKLNSKFEEKLKIGQINPIQEKLIKNLVRSYEDVFEYDKEKVGRVDLIKHRIKITPGQNPILQRRYKETEEKGKFIKKEVEKLLETGKIRESYSPWASPVTLAGKKSGNYRFCIDYRKLNAVTKSDAYPLPRIDELLDKYRTAKWFTSIDLAAGFHQVEMIEEDKEKTAFICSQGLYEYNVMPFGLKNAPGTFQRLMDKVLKEYIGEFVVVYIDDIMIYSKNFEEHLQHIEKVLRKMRETNLTLKLKKCKFGERNIEFLGHIVGKDGLQPDVKKVETINKIKPPQTIREVRSFLGLCSYYRKFIKNYSKIAKPITKLIKKDEEFRWGQEQQNAFKILKEKLTQKPILAHPDFEKEFILLTDASAEGLGAILSKKNDEGKEVVISYASKSNNNTEANYPITDLECLAIVWGIRYFHKFLIGRKFKVITDHAALKGLMNDKIPKGRRARWIMELQQYDFEVIHRSGKENKNADALSRLKYEKI
ncbi:unnamed protein product [Rhizophagus irregularis]|nr:unnamed protein product [Rhizophagus irregularis]